MTLLQREAVEATVRAGLVDACTDFDNDAQALTMMLRL